jgi:hypothetical protein
VFPASQLGAALARLYKATVQRQQFSSVRRASQRREFSVGEESVGEKEFKRQSVGEKLVEEELATASMAE